GDYRHWTEREWRILARLVGHGIGPVPDVVQFDRGAADRPALVQTYDAGITVDHWATLLPVQRDAALLRHVFEDCAHWWALARHCLIALDAIHELQLVHLDLKADNVCIPAGPADFDPYTSGQRLFPCFEQITLIDFAFSLVSGESLLKALPIAHQAGYDYQSPRLLHALEAGNRGDLQPTRQLDWRCDIFSLAAMLRRYLPDPDGLPRGAWTHQRHAQARALVRHLLQAHDADRSAQRPHGELIALTAWTLDDPELTDSLQRGWTLALRHDKRWVDSPTPVTRIAPRLVRVAEHMDIAIHRDDERHAAVATAQRGRDRPRHGLWLAGRAAVVGGSRLGATWLSLEPRRDSVDETIASAPVAEPVPASAPTEGSSPAPSGVIALDAQPSRRVAAPAIAASAVSEPAVASAPAVGTSVLASASDDAPGSGSVAPRQPTAPPTARAPTPIPSSEAGAAATPQRGAARGRPAERPAQAAVPVRAPAMAVTRPRGRDALDLSAVDRAMASLSARGPAPRSASASTAPTQASPSLPATARAPAPAAALAPATATASQSTPASSPAQAPAPGTPQPIALPDNMPVRKPPDFAARADDLMTSTFPRVAQRAERAVSRVLVVAAQPDSALLDDEIRAAARANLALPQDPLLAIGNANDEAWLLHEAARIAYWHRGNLQEAITLQTQAFGANPLNAEVVRNLAFLRLKQQPAQADAARQLALHALTLSDTRHPGGRIEDWTTLAVASALSGRNADARTAWFVTLALAPNLERQCKVAVDAYATHGERLSFPVQAMLHRVRSSSRPGQSPYCEWPPHWEATRRLR
ncbi:MAG: hypothetical protein ACRC2B_23420, partial [Rubrivivax sp.]